MVVLDRIASFIYGPVVGNSFTSSRGCEAGLVAVTSLFAVGCQC